MIVIVLSRLAFICSDSYAEWWRGVVLTGVLIKVLTLGADFDQHQTSQRINHNFLITTNFTGFSTIGGQASKISQNKNKTQSLSYHVCRIWLHTHITDNNERCHKMLHWIALIACGTLRCQRWMFSSARKYKSGSIWIMPKIYDPSDPLEMWWFVTIKLLHFK